MEHLRRTQTRKRAGMTLIEVSISAAIMSVVLMAMIAGVQSETKGLSNMVSTTTRERQAQEIVGRIESELEYAAAALPNAFLQSAVGPTSNTITLDNSRGFPPFGVALVDPGGPGQSEFRYSTLAPATNQLGGIQPVVDCPASLNAGIGVSVLWAGAGFAIANQTAPPANQFDGMALGITGPVFFRGSGTGFAFRLPTDPTGGSNFFDASGVTWGGTVDGNPSLSGWAAFDFQPESRVTEAELNVDVNLDGDELDEFDLGRMRMYMWDADNAGGVRDTGLGPDMILQERCNYGGDMDGDGFDDPIFLWNELEQSVSISLTVHAGAINENTVIRRVQTTVFLRNGSVN